MTMTAAPIVPTTATTSTESRPALRWRTVAGVGVTAAAATTAVAAGALAAGVPLEIDGEQIPLAGFAQLTFICTVVGVVLAKAMGRWASRPQRTFTTVAMALTGLSFVPDLAVSATPATTVALMATHVVAAAIVIPALAGRLPEHRS